ncbi:MAG: PD-(D/E)XK nuclease family protein, partial [Casimicrobiaceae bacterium]
RATRQALELGVRSRRLVDALRQARLFDRLHAVETAIGGFRHGVRRTRAQWAECYAALVAALTEAAPVLDSSLLQLQRALYEAIECWRSLDRWLKPVTHAEGHGELINLTDRSPFQPEAHGQAVQVIGLLESSGLPHDGLWFARASADLLPERVSLNRALDPGWQRRYRVGRAVFANVQARAEALVGHWRTLGPVCIASRADEEDGAGGWSLLVAAWPFAQVEELMRASPSEPEPRDDARLEWLADEVAPPKPPLRRARVRDFEQQAICPRRGFISARLGAEPWPLPAEGVPPRLRGNLLHTLAEHYGRAILGRDSRSIAWSGLRASIGEWVRLSAERYASELERLPAVVRRAELRRIERIMHRFIEAEQQRTAFTVREVESSQATEIGGLHLNLKIDRIDEIAATARAGCGFLVVDYKTGRVDTQSLTDERLTAPQLAIYALAAGRSTVGVAYAVLADDELGLRGLGRGWQALDALAETEDDTFDRLRSFWAERLAALAAELSQGEAALAPVEGLRTCERCPVRSACGIDRVLDARDRPLIEGDEA